MSQLEFLFKSPTPRPRDFAIKLLAKRHDRTSRSIVNTPIILCDEPNLMFSSFVPSGTFEELEQGSVTYCESWFSIGGSPSYVLYSCHFISDLVYIAPSGVQKELMKNTDIYVMAISEQDPNHNKLKERTYLRSPPCYKPSQCTPLFLAAFTRRGAGCCIHTHSQWAVLVTLLLEAQGPGKDGVFEINNIEQIKGFGRGMNKTGNLGYHDTLRIPVIENTPHEEDLTEYLEEAMDKFPDTYAVLVRRHGVYVWGDNVHKAKTQCER